MSAIKEKRSSKRYRIQNSCMICRNQSGDQINVSTICDISKHGMGFYTRDAVEAGSLVEFNFTLPPQKENTVNGKGNVVWVASLKDIFGETITRCGMRFKNLPAGSQSSIDKYIRSFAKSKDKPSP